MNLNHLTDEQFADLLAGDKADQRALVHLETCTTCRQELTEMTSAVGDLNFASLRWAEQRALDIKAPSRWALNWHGLPGWGATMAAVLIFGVALGAHMPVRNSVEPALQPAHAVSAPSADELAEDNQLMRSIDSELSEPGTQVVSADVNASSPAIHHRSLREVSN